jgi:hypothetical protein
MSNVLSFPRRNFRPERPVHAGQVLRYAEGRAAILETIARIVVRDSVFTPYEKAAVLAKLRTEVRADCTARKLSVEDQIETMRHAERMLDDILDGVDD